MNTVYCLRDDPFMAGSRSERRTGLAPSYGPVGSEAWWHAVSDGRLPIKPVQGAVSGYWPGQHGDGPAEFALRTADGHTSKWLCELSPEVATPQFVIGRRVAVEFVEPELKHEYEGTKKTRLTLSISLE